MQEMADAGMGMGETDFTIEHMRTEYDSEPIGIGTARPRFSWRMGARSRVSGRSRTASK